MKFAFLFCAFLIALVLPPFLFGIGPVAPDGKLYIGIAEHFFSTGRYEDIIRHDEILPTIGHPALLHIFGNDGVIYAGLVSLAATLAFILSYGRWWATIPTLLAAFAFSDEFIQYYQSGAVIGSIILGSAALCASTFWFLIKPSGRSLALLSLAFALSLLIRPILLPVTPLAILAVAGWSYISGLRWKLAVMSVGGALWIAAYVISIGSSGDSRMVTGTYGAIPLYSAWNPYINLQTNYNSAAWKSPHAEPGTKNFENRQGWKERDARLKKMALEFAISNPVVGGQGYLFRLSRYTTSAEKAGCFWPLLNGYLITLMLASGWFLFMLGRSIIQGSAARLIPGAVFLSLFFVTAAVSALFVYSGVGYLAGTFSLLLISLAGVGAGTNSTLLQRNSA